MTFCREINNSDLEELLSRQARRELSLRLFKEVNAPTHVLKNAERLVKEIKQEIKSKYGEVPECLKRGIYLSVLETRDEGLMGRLAKPYCPDCRFMYEYLDGTKIPEKDIIEGSDCSKHPGRPEEIAMSDFALCENFEIIYGTKEDHENMINKELDIVRQFIKELEQKV